MKIQFKKWFLSMLIPLCVGLISYWLIRDNLNIYSVIVKPPLAPSSGLFMVVWPILYVFMGQALYFVLVKEKTVNRTDALISYGLQLFFNFVWPLLFFNSQLFLISLVWVVMLELLIVDTLLLFYKIDKRAVYFMIPYFVWVGFATYLNFMIYVLN